MRRHISIPTRIFGGIDSNCPDSFHKKCREGLTYADSVYLQHILSDEKERKIIIAAYKPFAEFRTDITKSFYIDEDDKDKEKVMRKRLSDNSGYFKECLIKPS